MKRTLLLIISIIVFANTAIAQIDISRFNRVGEAAISALVNCPEETWGETGIDEYPMLGTETMCGYGPSGCVIVINPYDKGLRYFSTESANFCVLSNIVPGGIKVGTKLSDLEKIDFVNTRYGRGKQGNALKYVQSTHGNKEVYGIFYEEYQSILLYVSNGIVSSFQFITSEADIEYDKSIKFFE